MSSPWEAVAAAVKQRRLDLGLTVRDAAKAGRMSTTTWLTLEKHREPVGDAKRRGFASALGWPPDAIDRMLLGEPENPLVAAVERGVRSHNEQAMAVGEALVELEGRGPDSITDSMIAGLGEMLIRYSSLSRVDQRRIQTLVLWMADRDDPALPLRPEVRDALDQVAKTLDGYTSRDTDIREAWETTDDDYALAADTNAGDEGSAPVKRARRPRPEPNE